MNLEKNLEKAEQIPALSPVLLNFSFLLNCSGDFTQPARFRLLLPLSLNVHINNPANHHYCEYNKARFAFALVLANEPDKEGDEWQHKNCPEDK